MKQKEEEQYLSLMNDLHTKAMHLSDEAFYGHKRQTASPEEVRKLYLQAFRHERAAAMTVVYNFDLEPTRSVLFRSAASLLLSLPELTKGDYEEAERMIAFGMMGKPHPEIAAELRDVWNQLQQKYQQQRWRKEFLTEEQSFEKMGVFTVINSKTLEFEFQTYSGVDLKGAYPLELDRKIKTVSLKNGYTIKGEICKKSQQVFLSDVIGVEILV